MDYNKIKNISEAAQLELIDLLEKHDKVDRGYEDNNRWRQFDIENWEPKRVIKHDDQISVYVAGKNTSNFNVTLSRMRDKGSAHVRREWEGVQDVIMQDLGDRSKYELFTGRISDHYSNELRMRQTEMEFIYISTPAREETIILWCGGIHTVWRRQYNKGHFTKWS